MIFCNEGIAQLVFMRGKPCLTSYADRKGKYQNQVGVTLAKVVD
jgi:dCTP deaminase